MNYLSPPLDPKTGLAIKGFDWGGHHWNNDSGQVWNKAVPYAIGLGDDGNHLRMELHDTPNDCGQHDMTVKETFKRRAEMRSAATADRFFNNKLYWHAFSFKHHWTNPAAMAKSGHLIMQMHWPSGASPAFAMRLPGMKGGAAFEFTTRNDSQGNTTRYKQPIALDTIHDVVYRFKLNSTAGLIDIWLDGQHIVNLPNVPMGAAHEDGYAFSMGPYGQPLNGNCPVAEYAHIAQLAANVDLTSRITSPPAW